MGGLIGSLFAIWLIGGLVYSGYWYLSKSDKSQSVVQRKIYASVQAPLWPLYAYRYFAGRQQAVAQENVRQADERRILGDFPEPPSNSPFPTNRPSAPRVQNPFDDM